MTWLSAGAPWLQHGNSYLHTWVQRQSKLPCRYTLNLPREVPPYTRQDNRIQSCVVSAFIHLLPSGKAHAGRNFAAPPCRCEVKIADSEHEQVLVLLL